ncbi:MAG: GHMP family kinase ATP-binding protein [Promethearchaeota archaeon]
MNCVEIKVAVPHRISGFFEIMENSISEDPKMEDYCAIGSRGGGPCLGLLGITRVRLMDDAGMKSRKHPIYINGTDCTTTAKTSLSVINWMPGFIAREHTLEISHEFPVPIGAGYGTSGCGAIGIAIAINVMFDLGWSLDECGKIAHCAEVKNKTGLGTVGGQIRGGCTITIAPGYPFTLNTIIIPPGWKIACASQGTLLTSSILKDEAMRKSIIKAGRKAMEKIMKAYTIENFMRVSIQFVHDSGMLAIPELDLGGVKNLMSEINKLGNPGILGASMNQLGRSVYCIYRDTGKNEEIIRDIFEKHDFCSVKFMCFHQDGPEILEVTCPAME